MKENSETVSYHDLVKKNFEDLEKEDFERQREVFLLNFFKRRGLSFEKENLDKPVTLRTVLEIIMEVSNK